MEKSKFNSPDYIRSQKKMSIILGFIGIVLLFIIVNTARTTSNPELDSITNQMSVNTMKGMQILSSLLLFIVIPLFLAYFAKNGQSKFFNSSKSAHIILFIVALIVFPLLSPLLEALQIVNNYLPFTKDSQQMNLIMVKLLTTNSIWDLLINIFMVAVIPAVGEELFFRGCFQKYLINATKIPWLGILLAAFIFSIGHGEMQLLVPRWFMGAILGLLYFFSNNIWVPILAHFVNNLMAVLGYYFYTIGELKTNPLTSKPEFQPLFVMGSLVFLATVLLVVFKHRTIKTNNFNTLSQPE